MPDDIHLRPARAEDEAYLLGLRRRTIAVHMARLGMATDDGAMLARVRDHYDDARIICSGVEYIGLFKAYREDDSWLLAQVQIEPCFQGRGVGARLIRDLMAQATRDALPIRLHVLDGNPARRLYERLGFSEVGVTEDAAILVWHPARS